jgi:hypothetical protein
MTAPLIRIITFYVLILESMIENLIKHLYFDCEISMFNRNRKKNTHDKQIRLLLKKMTSRKCLSFKEGKLNPK